MERPKIQETFILHIMSMDKLQENYRNKTLVIFLMKNNQIVPMESYQHLIMQVGLLKQIIPIIMPQIIPEPNVICILKPERKLLVLY